MDPNILQIITIARAADHKCIMLPLLLEVDQNEFSIRSSAVVWTFEHLSSMKILAPNNILFVGDLDAKFYLKIAVIKSL